MDKAEKAAYHKAYWEKNRGRLKVQMRQYREANKKKLLEGIRQWRLKNLDKVKAAGRKWALKNHRAEYQRQWRLKNPAKYRESAYKQRERHPEKIKARLSINNAIQCGRLIRQDCHCGGVGEAHHADYSKPFQITWLCRTHHAELHRKYK